MYLTPILQVRLHNTSNLDLKVDKITGKGLSTEDYTTEKNKVSGFLTEVLVYLTPLI
jgi:hypothetical protein